MKHAFNIILIAAMAVAGSIGARAGMREEPSNSELLQTLDQRIRQRAVFCDRRKAKGDSIQNLIDLTDDPRQKLPLLLESIEVWRGLSTDSVVNICNRGMAIARETHDSVYMQQFFLNRAHAFFFRGQSHDCLADIAHVESMGVRPEVKYFYHYVGHVAYTTLADFYSEDQQWTDYMNKGRYHIKALVDMNKKGSAPHYYYDGMLDFIDGNPAKMINKFQKVIEMTSPGDMIHPLAYTFLGHQYELNGDLNRAVNCLSIAAALQVEAANLHEVPTLLLGEILYRNGDITRAGNYLATAIEDATQGNMKFNMMRFNRTLLDVNKEIESDSVRQYWTLVIMVVLLVGLIVILCFMIRGKRGEVKKLRKAESRLERANLAKETYITEFMSLCSSYIESLEDYNKMSKRKITAGQADELLAFIKSGKIIDEQREKFFDVFDRAFLQLFPDYLKQVNALLLPDKQITVSNPGVLTAELRILALSRLGIDDVQVVSRFLGISTNTIYTYRNKLRTRAIDRTTFDENARMIGVV